jgi:Aerotolerance regulator N-terminal/von Willebrand factor type A domain
MSFLNAWAIGIGTAALLAPLAVHFLTKPRPVSFPLSTIRFLREVIEQRRARSRIRDFIVLLLRMLAVGLLAMALARPLWEQAPLVAARSTGEVSRVVMIDVSQSMSAGGGGSTVLQRAQATALRYLDYSLGLQADVVFIGAKPRGVFGRLSPNLASLRESVRQAATRPERADVKAAMEEAGRLLGSAPERKLELVVISDFQRGNWSSLFLDRIPEGCSVQLESAAGDDRANLAIAAVRFPSRPVAGQECALEVELANYSDRESSVRCRVDFGSVQHTLEGRIAPQGNRTLSTSIEFPEAGWFAGWARLEANLDALSGDDVRPVAAHVAHPPRVLLVSRQPSQQKPASSFYLEQALSIVVASAGKEGNGKQSIQRIQPQRLDAPQWPDADLFVLDHPGSLDAAALEHIALRVRRGGALLYLTGELVDGINLRSMATSLGTGFQPPVELVPVTDGAIRKDLFIGQLRGREAPFRIFGDSASAVMRTARFGGGLATRKTKEGLQDQILASLSDLSALMYITACDAGQIAVLNADLDRSSWCVQPSFLPVLSELLQELLSSRSQPGEAFCGEPMVRLLSAEIAADASLAVSVADQHTPSASEYGRWEWSATQGSLVWSWGDPPGAGVYQLAHGDSVVAMVATAAPPSEADLKSLEQSVLQGRLAGSRQVGFRDQTDSNQPEDQLWTWLIVACVLGLASEIVVLRWFHS